MKMEGQIQLLVVFDVNTAMDDTKDITDHIVLKSVGALKQLDCKDFELHSIQHDWDDLTEKTKDDAFEDWLMVTDDRV
jgi:hypothetical protein